MRLLLCNELHSEQEASHTKDNSFHLTRLGDAELTDGNQNGDISGISFMWKA
jgi:hypothetical protein